MFALSLDMLVNLGMFVNLLVNLDMFVNLLVNLDMFVNLVMNLDMLVNEHVCELEHVCEFVVNLCIVIDSLLSVVCVYLPPFSK